MTVTRDVNIGIQIAGKDWVLDDLVSSQIQVSKTSWSNYPFYKPDVRDGAVVVCDSPNEEVKQLLLDKYGVITQAYVRDCVRYTRTFDNNLRLLINDYRRASEAGLLLASDYVSNLGYMTSTTSDFRQGTIIKDYGSKEQTIYFIGIPKTVMLSMWDRYTDSASLIVNVLTDEGLLEIDLVKEVYVLCSRYESIQSAGCLACPHRNSCIDTLLEQKVSLELAPTMQQVKKVLKTLDYLLLHSDCSNRNYGITRLDYTRIDMTLAHARAELRSNQRLQMASNREFYRDNCSKCSLAAVCGSTKSFTGNKLGVKSFCSGRVKRELVVTEDNYRDVFKATIASILAASHTDKGAWKLEECMKRVNKWVETDVTMPSHAAYYDRKLDSLRKKGGTIHSAYYVIPRELLDISNVIDLSGSFEYSNVYYNHPEIGDWLEESSSGVRDVIGACNKESKWVAILPAHRGIKPKVFGIASPRHECLDTKMLFDLELAKYNSKSKKYRCKLARINLLAEFLLLFLTPGAEYYYGSFGNSKAWLPTGLPDAWEAYALLPETTERVRRGRHAEIRYPRQDASFNVKRIMSRLRVLPLAESHMLIVLEHNNFLKEIVDG